MNWFIPALMKSSVGSSCGTTGDDGQWVCAARVSKNSTNLRRTCATDVNDCAACSFSKKATSAGIGSAGIVSSTASTADLRRTANLWRSRYDATSGARRASGGGDPGAPGSLDALLERCSACGRARELRAAARELRGMRQQRTRKAYGFAGISLIAALTASVRRSASFMLTTYALASSTLIAAPWAAMRRRQGSAFAPTTTRPKRARRCLGARDLSSRGGPVGSFL